MMILRTQPVLEDSPCDADAVKPDGYVMSLVVGEVLVAAAWTDNNCCTRGLLRRLELADFALDKFHLELQPPTFDVHEMICSPSEFSQYNKLLGNSISERETH